MKDMMIGLLRVYQLALSGLLGPRCRFYPSCSNYMLQAIDRYGVCRGFLLGLMRLCKCHPFHPGGYDPVPGNDRTAPGHDKSVARDRE